MRIVVTGAAGFVGRALVSALRREPRIGDRAIERVTLLDTAFAADEAGMPHERRLTGSIADAEVVRAAFRGGVDAVFHLASIPGGTAEQHYALGRDVNLGGTTHLLEAAQAQVLTGGPAPVFVFASSIAVFGAPLPSRVDDDTPCAPQMSYGAQKLIGEILVADFSRRGGVDGRSVRLPGVLARPPAKTGQLSAFMSEAIRELLAGRAMTMPTRPEATTWASSIGNTVENLLHAAAVETSRLAGRRTFTLPTLRFSFAELVAAIGAVRGQAVDSLVDWRPDGRIEALFGSFPPLETPAAERAGFRRDANLPTLVRRALAAA